MKAILIEDEDGQIVAYTRRGTFRDFDHAIKTLGEIDKIPEYDCCKLTKVGYEKDLKQKLKED